MLRLRTLAGKELGPIPFVSDLKFAINYADLSTISFTVPYQVNGMLNPLYSALSSYKIVYTDQLGIYVLSSPSKSGDGISETKTVTGYSLEQLFSKKNLFLEEGTYNFWNPASPSDTILGRITELDQTWHIGYVTPRLIGCYRTFDQYDSDALSFCYGDAMEKYHCAFVFDVYERSINVYDANENTGILPIYLNYNNLISAIRIDEITDEMVTKLHLYGSDSLTIRDINPTGTDYIVDLSYFLHNGDLDVKIDGSQTTLADRVRNWMIEVEEKRRYYSGLSASRASLTAEKMGEESRLTDLKGELDSLTAQQSVIIQAYSLEVTDEGKRKQQESLDRVNEQIAEKQREIDTQNTKIKSLSEEIDRYASNLKEIVSRLSFTAYFSDEEQKILNQYFIEGNVEEETFVATDIESSASGVMSSITGKISVTSSDITRIELSQFGRTMYTISGGSISLGGSFSAEIVRGTMDVKTNSRFVLTASLGNTSYGERKFSSGLITVTGTLSQFSSDIAYKTEQEITEYKGTHLNFQTDNADSYFTVNTGEFHRYSVAAELYDFGSEILNDLAWPAYEFNIDSANFLYQEKFAPFKNKLELGKSVYLELGSDGRLTPKIIGIELDFEDIGKFKLTFSNRYQLKNGVEKWIEEIRSTTRSLKVKNNLQ